MEGASGSGKTTLGLQFLLEGAKPAKRVFTSRCLKLSKSCGRPQPLITGLSRKTSTSSNWYLLRAFWTRQILALKHFFAPLDLSEVVYNKVPVHTHNNPSAEAGVPRPRAAGSDGRAFIACCVDADVARAPLSHSL